MGYCGYNYYQFDYIYYRSENINIEDKAKWNGVKEALNDQIIGMSEIQKMDDSNWDVATTVNNHIRSAINKIESYTKYIK